MAEKHYEHKHLLATVQKYFGNLWKIISQMIPAGHSPAQLSSRPNVTYQVLLTKMLV